MPARTAAMWKQPKTMRWLVDVLETHADRVIVRNEVDETIEIMKDAARTIRYLLNRRPPRQARRPRTGRG